MPPRKPVVVQPDLTPPAHLNAEAVAHWGEVLASLSLDHDLTPSDRDILAIYCDYFARWKKARAEIDSSGLLVKLKNDENPRPNPFIAIADQCAREMRGLLGELGLTPAARRRLRELKDREVTHEDIARIQIELPHAGTR